MENGDEIAVCVRHQPEGFLRERAPRVAVQTEEARRLAAALRRELSPVAQVAGEDSGDRRGELGDGAGEPLHCLPDKAQESLCMSSGILFMAIAPGGAQQKARRPRDGKNE